MKKHTYEQPLAEIFELRLSASVLNNISDGVNYTTTPGGVSGDDIYDPNDGEGF